jgi:uncharacterized membrane protein
VTQSDKELPASKTGDFIAVQNGHAIEAELESVSKGLPPAKAEQLKAIVTRVSRFHSGPLPSPDLLIQYERALPGLAERITQMAEVDLAHGHAMDRKLVSGQFRERLVGLAFGGLIAFSGLAGSAWVMVNGSPWAGSFLAGGTLAAVIFAFIGGRDYLIAKANVQEKQLPRNTQSQKRKK